jgi:hypothetical protein
MTDLKTHACPKCNSKMTAGFMQDVCHHTFYGRFVFGAPPAWIGSSPAKKATLFDYRDAVEREVVTYCCDSCGYLESHALPAGTRLVSVLKEV